MTPEIPFPPREAPPPPPPSDRAFWSYLDVAMFIVLGVISFALTLVATTGLSFLRLFTPATRIVLAQCVLYVLIVASLYLLITVRYGRPFWPSMGFRSQPHWIRYAVLGVILAFAAGALGALLRARQIDLPFQEMLRSRSAIISLGILVVLLGPLCEELVFRGFLMPLFVRSMGAVAGIVLAGVLFGAMHGPEYQWSWQHVVLISGVGVAFGWARYRTHSTIPAALMHSAFNLTQFTAFILLGKQ